MGYTNFVKNSFFFDLNSKKWPKVTMLMRIDQKWQCWWELTKSDKVDQTSKFWKFWTKLHPQAHRNLRKVSTHSDESFRCTIRSSKWKVLPHPTDSCVFYQILSWTTWITIWFVILHGGDKQTDNRIPLWLIHRAGNSIVDITTVTSGFCRCRTANVKK